METRKCFSKGEIIALTPPLRQMTHPLRSSSPSEQSFLPLQNEKLLEFLYMRRYLEGFFAYLPSFAPLLVDMGK
jgi:hypothetical protein